MDLRVARSLAGVDRGGRRYEEESGDPVARRIELQMYRDADAIVSVTQAFKTDLALRGIDPTKISVVLNGVDVSRYRSIPKDEALLGQFDLRGKLVVGYLGTHGMAHALDKVADAATILRNRSDIVFLFAGAGAKRANWRRQ